MKLEAFEAMGLLCPKCGGRHVSHSNIELFQREEDAEKGLYVRVINRKVIVDDNVANTLNKNPSERRSGMNIHFACEDCGSHSILSIAQHKGETFINFQEI